MRIARITFNRYGERYVLKGKIAPAYKLIGVVAIGLIASTRPAVGGDFDGSKPLYGTTAKIIEINQYKIIDDVDPDTVGVPKKFRIDFHAKTLRPSRDSLVRKTIAFKSVEHIENKMVMQGIDEGVQGVDDGLAWSLTISKKNGTAVLAASGDGVAYVVFGVCTPIRDHQ